MDKKHELVTITPTELMNPEQVLQENHQRIMNRDGSKVFPITVPLRKKLEALKATSLGDLRIRMSFIEGEKKKEFLQNNEHRVKEMHRFVKKENTRIRSKVKLIMKRKRAVDKKVNLLRLQSDREFSKESGKFFQMVDESIKKEPDYITSTSQHGFPLKRSSGPEDDEDDDDEWEKRDKIDEEKRLLQERLNEIEQGKKDSQSFLLTFDEKAYRKDVLETEFKEKFGKPFGEAQSRINQLELQFDESLLFGDMEVAKKVYYNLRQAEQFIDQLTNMRLS